MKNNKFYTVKQFNSQNYVIFDFNGIEVEEISNFFKFLIACGKSPNTIRAYAYHLKLFLDYCILCNINYKEIFSKEDIKPVDFFSNFILWLQYPDSFRSVVNINGLRQMRSNATINVIMTAVMSFYEYMRANDRKISDRFYHLRLNVNNYRGFLSELIKQDKYVSQSIFQKPKINSPVKYITRAQYKDLIGYCLHIRDKLLLALLFEGGLRLSEALGIHVEDVQNIQEGIIAIVPRENNANGARVKNNSSGLIKVPNYVIDLLLCYLNKEIADIQSEYLFLNLKGISKGTPLRMDTVEKLFLRLGKCVGYRIHPHMLRHGFATEKLEAGWELIEIQAYLRHRSISSTQIYAQYSDALKIKKMKEFYDQNDVEMKGLYYDIQKN